MCPVRVNRGCSASWSNTDKSYTYQHKTQHKPQKLIYSDLPGSELKGDMSLCEDQTEGQLWQSNGTSQLNETVVYLKTSLCI